MRCVAAVRAVLRVSWWEVLRAVETRAVEILPRFLCRIHTGHPGQPDSPGWRTARWRSRIAE
ncbi:hypothetical protein QJS66_03355 [Kocuria rhizophila]|nr:hypothetical protein QJS66_03355 [Kocuria rhizophila]